MAPDVSRLFRFLWLWAAALCLMPGQTALGLNDPFAAAGELQVSLQPAAAVTAGAGWRLPGESDFHSSSEKISVPPGTYLLEFRALSSFPAPPPQAVQIRPGALTTATAAYGAPTGSLPALVPDLHLRSKGGIYAMARQADGRIIVAGSFVEIDGVRRESIARLETDGSLDLNWNPGADGSIFALLVDGDSVYVGGRFTQIGGAERNGMAKLSLSGSGAVDLAFNPGFKRTYKSGIRDVKGTAYPEVLQIVRNADAVFVLRRLLFLEEAEEKSALKLDPVTGVEDPRWGVPLKTAAANLYFNVAEIAAAPGAVYLSFPVPTGNIFRFSSVTGEDDLAWRPPPGEVSSIRAVGDFLYALRGNNVSRDLLRLPLAGNGEIDESFTRQLPGAFAIGDIGRGFLYIFDQQGLARASTTTGDLDASWQVPLISDPFFPNTAVSVVAAPEGVLIAADPGKMVDATSDSIARYALASASLDQTFHPSVLAEFGDRFSVATTAGGDILLNNRFDLLRVAGRPVGAVPRFRADGTLDVRWNVELALDPELGLPYVENVVVDDKYAYISGFFSEVNGVPRLGLARLPLDGQGGPDPGWNPQPPVRSFVPYKLLVHRGALYFVVTYTDGDRRTDVLKYPLDGSGQRDPQWQNGLSTFSPILRPLARFGLESIVAIGDGLYVGGGFRTLSFDGNPISRALLRIRTDGAGGIDPNFVAPATPVTTKVAKVPPETLAEYGYTGPRNGTLRELAGPSLLATDGESLFGAIDTYAGAPPLLVKYSAATGEIDRTWQPKADGFVSGMAAVNGFVYLGGFFKNVNGIPRSGIARVTSSGAGAVDPAWKFSVRGSVSGITSVANDLIVAGSFSAVSGLPRANFAFLPTLDAPVIQPLADQPAAFGIRRNALDGPHVTHFQVTSITGGDVRLIATGELVPAGSFVSAEDAARGFTFEPALGPPVAQTVTAVAALGEGVSVPEAPAATYTLNVQVRPPVFQFGTTQYFIREGAGAAMLTLLKTGTGSASVAFATVDGSAVAVTGSGGDYVPASGRIDFAGNETSKTIQVQIADDALFRGDRRFSVKLSAPSAGAVVGEPSAATVAIVEDDAFGTVGSSLDQMGPIALPAATSSIAVQLTPAEAHGQWRLAGEQEWRASGAVATGLTAGNYIVEFSPVPGFLEPPPQTVAIAVGVAANESAVYQAFSPGANGTLQVLLKPDSLASPSRNPHAEWRLQGEDDSQWRDSGETRDLSGGVYVVEFRALPGYVTPPLQRAEITPGLTRVVSAAYLVAGGTTGADPQPVSTADAASAEPYIYNGQIRSSVGYGSGAVTHERVVLTASHVLFDDVELSQAQDVVWLPQKIAGTYEPQPVRPRGWFIFEGYAAQRRLDNSPGESSPASQELDAAAMFFAGDASRGQFGGYLAAVNAPGEFLASSRLKMIVGYPVEGVAANLKGVLHATAPANLAFSATGSSVFATEDAYSLPGVSGGPLYVQADNGTYYPAGIYLGGTDETLVRAIDGDISDLLNRARAASTGGGNNTGGGITVTSPASSNGNTSLVQVKCVLSPAAAVQNGARWRLTGEMNFRRSGDTATVVFGTRTIEFAPAAGFVAPAPIRFTLAAGSQAIATGVYAPSLQKPEIVGNLQKTGVLKEKFAYQIAATHSPTLYAQVGLPDGLTLDTRTGLISGTPNLSADSEVLLTASNAAGTSTPRTLRISILPKGVLNVEISGSGSVTPGFLGSTPRLVGQRLSITAKPATGFVFDGWTGDLPTIDQRIVFTMPEVLFLSAKFVRSPFLGLAGTYQGYARGTTGAAAIRVTLSSAGSFSLTARMRGQMYTARGVLSSSGSYDGPLTAANGTLTAMSLQLDLSGANDRLTGQIAPAGEAFAVTASRAEVFGPALPAPKGEYTLALPRDVSRAAETAYPQGSGYATVRVDARGRITFKGLLGDGTATSGSAALSPGGEWLFVVPGSAPNPTTIAGPITFGNDGTLSGALLWAKPPTVLRFPLGFSGTVMATGSLFESANLQASSPLAVGGVGGISLSKTATVNSDNTFTLAPPGADELRLSLNPNTGELSGSFRDSAAQLITVKGVVLPKQRAAYGIFVQPNATGYLELTPP